MVIRFFPLHLQTMRLLVVVVVVMVVRGSWVVLADFGTAVEIEVQHSHECTVEESMGRRHSRTFVALLLGQPTIKVIKP